jgi:hypothetical protein
MKKAFLKFNRDDASSLVCLFYWLEIFKDYELFLICDLFRENSPVPENLKQLLQNKNIKIKNTDYSLRTQTDHLFSKGWKVKASCANLTCFNLLDPTDTDFWIIDADDTMFLTRDFDLIRTKLLDAENILNKEQLDGLSLDFYREAHDQWSFGVCLLSSTIDLNKLKDATLFKTPIVNLDGAFDHLRKQQEYKLKSFIIDECGFQHLINKFPELDGGIYYWKNKKLWNIPLKDDIIIL